MSRRTLTDEQWLRIKGHLQGRAGTRGRSGVDNRLFVDAILWMTGNAARWRVGETVSRVRRHTGLRVRPDRQHDLEGPRRCNRRKRGAEAAAIGRSRGGLTTKLHAAVDAIGLPIRIHPTPGQYGDCPQAEMLLTGLRGVGHVIADAACDADPLRAFVADNLGATAHIKANPRRTTTPPIDWRLYKERHQVECFFNRLKRFCRTALRCEKTITAFMGFVHLACAMIWLW